MEIGVLNYVKEEGIKEKAYTVAKKLLEDDIPIEKIVQYSGLTIEEITTLKNSK